jgi:hypothetical protein
VAECGNCGFGLEVSLPVLPARRLSDLSGFRLKLSGKPWLLSAREISQSSMDFILDFCGACGHTVTVSRERVLEVACSHCGRKRNPTLDEAAMDILPVGDSSYRGHTRFGEYEVSWSPAHRILKQGTSFACPSCGKEQASFIGQNICSGCRAEMLCWNRAGMCMVIGVRAVGTKNGQPIDKWLPLREALPLMGNPSEHKRISVRVRSMILNLFGFAGCFLVGLLIVAIASLLGFYWAE